MDGVLGLIVDKLFAVSGALLSLLDFMLVSLSTLEVDLSLSVKDDFSGRQGVMGVVAPESTEGDGLSVDIFSLSLSDSSPLTVLLVCRRTRGMVNELTRGLCRRPSE